MTSRERLLKTLKGEKVDRVPVSTYELVGFNSHAFENQEPSYRDLMQVIREKTDCICMWNPHSTEQFALSAFPAETQSNVVTEGTLTKTVTSLFTPRGRELTATHQRYVDVHTVWTTEHYCKTIEDVDAYFSIPFEPAGYDSSDFERVSAEVGDHGIIMVTVSDPICYAMEIMEFGEATVWALTEREHFAKTIKEIHRRNMMNLENMLKDKVVDLYRIVGPEYATPPYLSPDFFREFVAPYIKEMTQLIHQHGGLVRIHSHGRIGEVLDMILDSGADAIDPCEAPPDGDIELAEVKRRIGDRMTIFGNIQLKLLEHGSKEEVIQAVVRCMEAAKEGGRYVIMPTAAPINVPLASKTEENYLTYIDAALYYGKYE
ncbi:MAG: uroporphyrinogen decarboxylase family protein [Clostridia bacterium]